MNKEPAIIFNNGSLWIVCGDEWARIDSREQLEKFLEDLRELGEQAFPLEDRGAAS